VAELRAFSLQGGLSVGSIFLYSEKSHRCVELRAPEIQTSDLIDLQGLLPRNLKGIQFVKPLAEGREAILFHSEGSPSQVSRYLMDVGQKLLGLGQPVGALRLFDLSLRIRHDPEVALLKAETLVSLGRMEEAKADLDRFLRWQPRNGLAYYLLGRIYLNRDDYQRVETYLKRSLQLMPAIDPRRGSVEVYLEFNQIYLDRDALYSRDLSPPNYVLEIQKLRQRGLSLREKILSHPDREVRGMEPHLDQLGKVFEHWLSEIAARNPEVLPRALASTA